MKATSILFAALALAAAVIRCTYAETWNLPAGGTWNDAASWNPTSIPNAVGAAAIFNGAATGSNPDQTGNRSVTLDGDKTVGSILFNNDLSTFTNSITTGTGGTLVFDALDGGPATIHVPVAAGTGNNTISVPTRLDDSLVATVDNVSATSAAGALNLTAAISGPGGFTKNGDGLVTFGTGAKTYMGATVLNGGRMRLSESAEPSDTASFTINAGAQLVQITDGEYTLGAGPLNLNGRGATTGPFAPFRGALRPDRNNAGRALTITNDVVLQSDSLIHVQALHFGGSYVDHSLTLPGKVSGSGLLEFTDIDSGDSNIGRLILTGTENTYSGGTLVRGGTLEARAATTSLGTGDVTILSGSGLLNPAAVSKLIIQAADNNAIADTATLSLAGGKGAGVADDGFVELFTDEVVGSLVLGAMTMAPGVYGSTLSAAPLANQFDEFFAGTGTVTVAAAAGVLGDYNGDGTVNAADYTVWRDNLGASTLPANRDPGNAGAVDQADYDFWVSRFGNSTGSASGSNVAVPEPASLALAALIAPLLLVGRHTRRRIQP